MTTFRSFPHITFPQWAIDAGFEDHSWSQDAAAIAKRPIEGTGSDAMDMDLLLTVSEDDPKDREGCEYPKYVLYVVDRANDGHILFSVYTGDNESLCHFMLHKFLFILRHRS